MRIVGRHVSLLVLVTPGLVVASAAAAHAAPAGGTTKPHVAAQAWFWKTAYEQVNPPLALVTPPSVEPSGVPHGDLAVAYTGDTTGASSKLSVVAFALRGVPKAATVDRFTVSLTLDSTPPATTVAASPAPVVACLPTRLWAPQQGGDISDAPTVDCATKVTPTVKGNVYTFDVTAIAQSWLGDENLGVAFVNNPTNTQTPFQAVFAGGAAVAAAMTYSPSPVVAPPTTGTPPPAPATSTGSTVTAPAPVAAGTTGSIPMPPTTTQAQPGGPAPQVAVPTPGATAAGRHLRPASAWPSAPFWVAAVAVALLVTAASLVLGDPSVPDPSGPTSRLDRALRRRRASMMTTSLTHTPPTSAAIAPRGA